MANSITRKPKKGRSTSPAWTSSSTSTSTERVKSKSKKSSNKEDPFRKMFSVNALIGIATLFIASGAIALFIASPSTHNLAMTMPHNSVRMMPMAPRPFSSGPTYDNMMQAHPSQGGNNAGAIFADARSTEDGKRQTNEGDSIISVNSDFSMTSHQHHRHHQTLPDKFNKNVAKHVLYYYYYDSTSEVFHMREEFNTVPHKPTQVSSFQNAISLPGKYQPSLCRDGQTFGFSDLSTVRNAIDELNEAYSDAVTRWTHYNSALEEYERIQAVYDHPGDVNIELPPPLPQHLTDLLEIEPDPFVICPFSTLRAPLGRHMPIHINAEDVRVECESCVIDTPGTHFSFGPHAKNVLISGVTLMGATESSIIFRHDGAEVSFENCYWTNNESVGAQGAVADMNSTSTVQFYHCQISDLKQPPRVGMHGATNPVVSSSLTLRT